MKLIRVVIILLIFSFVSFSGGIAQPQNGADAILLYGSFGRSLQWGTGWLNLYKPIDFKSGDKLRLKIGGTAKTILVRLLPKNQFPDMPVGIVTESIEVPIDRIVEIELIKPHQQIIQISVHGGQQAWSYSLGNNNGPATLVSAEYIRLK